MKKRYAVGVYLPDGSTVAILGPQTFWTRRGAARAGREMRFHSATPIATYVAPVKIARRPR